MATNPLRYSSTQSASNSSTAWPGGSPFDITGAGASSGNFSSGRTSAGSALRTSSGGTTAIDPHDSGGGSGGGGGDTGPGAVQLGDPGPITADTSVNPMQDYAFGKAKDYESGLANGTNEETVREISRARDEISQGMRAEGEGAMSRGADPTLFRTRALAQGARNIDDVQGKMADVALGRRAEANRNLTDAASSAASEQRLMTLGTLNQRLQEQRALVERAEAQARLNEMPYDRMMRMMSSVATYRNDYGGLQPGGGGGVSGGGSGLYSGSSIYDLGGKSGVGVGGGNNGYGYGYN